MTSVCERPCMPSYFPKYVFYIPNPCMVVTRAVMPCKNGYCCKLELARAKSMLVLCKVQLQLICHSLLTGGTVVPVRLIAVVPTVLEKSVFYKYLSVACVFLGLPIQFVHCCLVATRAYMPASLTVIPCIIVEISEVLDQLPVDDNNDEKSQLNLSIALPILTPSCNPALSQGIT